MVLLRRPVVIFFLPLFLLLSQQKQKQWFVNATKLRNGPHLDSNDNAASVSSIKQMKRSLQEEENCIGTEIRPGESLHRNEFLCSRINASGRYYYKFGIRPNGFFGEWRIDEGTGVETLKWTISNTSNKGETLLLDPKTGNLQLFDINNNLIWTNDCYVTGARFAIREIRGVQGYTPNDQAFWYTFGTDGTCLPPIYCKGNVLQRGDQLLRNEYLCPEQRSIRFPSLQIIFGLNNRGQLGYFHESQDDVLIFDFDTQAGIQADRLVLQEGDGNLVLYSEDNTPLWTSTKKCSGWTLERRTSSSVVLLKSDGETVVRYFDTNGDLSDCFPNVSLDAFDFPLLSRFSSDPRCRLSLIDHRHEVYTLLQVEKEGTLRYKLTANIGNNYCGLQKTTKYLNVLPSSAIVSDNNESSGISSYPCPEFDNVANLGVEPMGTPSSLGYHLMEDKHRPCSSFGTMLLYCAVVNRDLYS